MGVMLSATDCLNWLSRIARRTPSELTQALGRALNAPGPVSFYPYLSGERTPHNDSHIRGGFTGLSTNTSETHLTQAVLEGVAFGLRDSYEALKSTGVSIKALTAIGGGSASRYWLSLTATCLDVPLVVPQGREFGAALGAARLGMLAATSATMQEVIKAPQVSEMIDPVADLRAAFEDRYQGFREGYRGMRAIQ